MTARVEADLARRLASRLSVAADAQSLRRVEGELAASRALVKQRDVELASERANSAVSYPASRAHLTQPKIGHFAMGPLWHYTIADAAATTGQ